MLIWCSPDAHLTLIWHSSDAFWIKIGPKELQKWNLTNLSMFLYIHSPEIRSSSSLKLFTVLNVSCKYFSVKNNYISASIKKVIPSYMCNILKDKSWIKPPFLSFFLYFFGHGGSCCIVLKKENSNYQK